MSKTESLYGAKKEIQRFLLVVIFNICCRAGFCYLFSLAMANPPATVRNYVFCKSNGYFVRIFFKKETHLDTSKRVLFISSISL
jgi:hypothetical protein